MLLKSVVTLLLLATCRHVEAIRSNNYTLQLRSSNTSYALPVFQSSHGPLSYKYRSRYKFRQGKPGVSNRLIRKLFSNYHRATQLVRPLVVHLDVLLIKVKSTVEKEGIFESVIALFIDWRDSRLSWNPAQYGNITYLSLDPGKVGLPDIAMTNSADHLYSITRDHRFSVRVDHHGALKYVPTGTARTWCDLKLVTFPFDYQQCSLEFESWSLDNTLMTFDGKSELLLDTSFVSQLWTICHWKAITYQHTYFTNETFTRLRFDISVQRKSTFYIINLIFPCATLSMIQLCVFVISSQDTTADRIGFGTTNLLTLVVFQTIVTEEMPKTSDAVTALSKYIISLIVLSAIGIFQSVAVERIMATHHYPPPRWLIKVLKKIPAIWRELPRWSPEEESDNKSTSRLHDISTPTNELSPISHSVVAFPRRDEGFSPEIEHFQAAQSGEISWKIESPSPESIGEVERRITRAKSSEHVAPRRAQRIRGSKSTSVKFFSDSRTRSSPAIQPSTRLEAQRRPAVTESMPAKGRRQSVRMPSIGIPRRNSRLWKEVAFKMDVVCFIICATLAAAIPAFLFLPLIYISSNEYKCPGRHTDHANPPN